MAWRVLKYQCPYLGHDIVEIWDEVMPCVPANIYLREKAQIEGWERSTVESKAYRLVSFFRYLSAKGWSFWDGSVRLGGKRMLAFRMALQAHIVTLGTSNGDAPSPAVDAPTRKPITASRASDIMGEVLDLCRFWRQEGESELAGRKRPHNHKHEQRPPAFRIKVTGRPSRGKQSLTPVEYNQIWDFLLKNVRPLRPEFLSQRPRGDWPERRREEYEDAKRTFKLAEAWWARNLMLWALMSCTGLRRSEIPGVMRRDIVFHRETGYWVHLIAPSEAPEQADRRFITQTDLARFKTGGRTMYVGWEPRFEEAFKLWSSWRPILVGLMGEPDHGMLLVNGYGAANGPGTPLTVGGLLQWFRVVNEHLGPFLGDSLGGRPFRLSPHRIRHSLESMFKSWKIPLETRQAHLGHKRPDTTINYGTVYRTDYIADLNRFAGHLAGGLP